MFNRLLARLRRVSSRFMGFFAREYVRIDLNNLGTHFSDGGIVDLTSQFNTIQPQITAQQMQILAQIAAHIPAQFLTHIPAHQPQIAAPPHTNPSKPRPPR